MANIKISETALLTCGCRANNEILSKDIYAKYWMTPKAKELVKRDLEEVSLVENDLISLRNRFFLEQLQYFFESNKNSVFINLGAGFSNYPFLLNPGHKYCEVDTEAIISTKTHKLSIFQKKGIFPKRNVTFIKSNLNDEEELQRLEKSLKEWVGDSASFILAEGLIYYLSEDSIKNLFEIINKIQTPKSRLGIISWPQKFRNFPVFKRFCNFVKGTMGEESNKYVFHNPEEFRKIKDYKLVKQTNYIQLAKQYNVSLPKDNDFFWEDFSILEKTR